MQFNIQYILLFIVSNIVGLIHGNCTTGCSFDGTGYPSPGTEDPEFPCFNLTCTANNTWEVPNIESCVSCKLTNGINIQSYGKADYSFNGICNYSITQTTMDCDMPLSSYYPTSGIFTEFKYCDENQNQSCFDVTTFKRSELLFVRVTHSHPPTVEINGDIVDSSSEPIKCDGCGSGPSCNEASVIVWKSGNCVYIYGDVYLTYICKDSLVVYVTPKNGKELTGLCSGDLDMTGIALQLRDCTSVPLENVQCFVTQWEVNC